MGKFLDAQEAELYKQNILSAQQLKDSQGFINITSVPHPLPSNITTSSSTARNTLTQISTESGNRIRNAVQNEINNRLAQYTPEQGTVYFRLGLFFVNTGDFMSDVRSVKNYWNNRVRYLSKLLEATRNWSSWVSEVRGYYDRELINSLGGDLARIDYDLRDGTPSANGTRYQTLRTYFSVVEHARLYGNNAESLRAFENSKSNKARLAKESVDSVLETCDKNRFWNSITRLNERIRDAEGVVSYANQIENSINSRLANAGNQRYVMYHDPNAFMNFCRPG